MSMVWRRLQKLGQPVTQPLSQCGWLLTVYYYYGPRLGLHIAASRLAMPSVMYAGQPTQGPTNRVSKAGPFAQARRQMHGGQGELGRDGRARTFDLAKVLADLLEVVLGPHEPVAPVPHRTLELRQERLAHLRLCKCSSSSEGEARRRERGLAAMDGVGRSGAGRERD